jgi:hypothetical protein
MTPRALSVGTSRGTVGAGTGRAPLPVMTVTQHERKYASMNRTRLGLLGLCAVVFGIMAFGASGAQAEAGGKWLILPVKNGTAVEAGSLAANNLAVLGASLENNHSILLTKVLGSLLHLLCTAAQLIGVHLMAGGTLSNGKVRFTGCKTIINGTPAPECELHSAGKPVGTIETEEGKGLLALVAGGGVRTKITPVGTNFVTLQMGEACPIGETLPIKGTLYVKDCVAGAETKHLVTHLIEEDGVNSTVTVLGNSAKIDASVNLNLTGSHLGMEWGADAP